MGPAGQKIGTITTDPVEVDSIAIRAWRAIYNGNSQDLKEAVKFFKEKYIKFWYFGPVYNL